MFPIGIIVCQNHWRNGCPGIGSHILCFKAIAEKKGPLGNFPEAAIIAMEPCGGCPGNHASDIARDMASQDGARAIVLPTCLFTSARPCPHVDSMAAAIAATVGVPVLLGSYADRETLQNHPNYLPQFRPLLVEPA